MNYQEPQIGDVVEPNPNTDKPGWIDLMSKPLYYVLLSDGEVMPVWKDSLRLLY